MQWTMDYVVHHLQTANLLKNGFSRVLWNDYASLILNLIWGIVADNILLQRFTEIF